MAIGIVPIILSMGRRQREEDERRRQQYPSPPEKCWRPRGYRDDAAHPVPWPNHPVDSILPQTYMCGCVEFFLKWYEPEGLIAYRHLEKDCGHAPMELGERFR